MSANGTTMTPALSTRPPIPALALNVDQACAALCVSWDTFHREVEPELRIVRLGRRKLIPVVELERWLHEHAERVLEGAVNDHRIERL